MSDLADRVALLWAAHHIAEAESPEQFAADVARARRAFVKEMEAKPKATHERVPLTACEIESLTALVVDASTRGIAPEAAAALRLLVQTVRQGQ